MAGHLRKRGEAWELRAYVGRDPLNGTRQYATRSFKGTKREADRALAAFVVDVERGNVAAPSVTVAELLERWFELAAPDFSPKTALETRGYMDRNLLPALGKVKLAKLQPDLIDRYYQELRLRGGRNGRPLAPGTIKRIHVILRRALNQAVRWGWIADNPAAKATPPRVPVSEIAPPAPREVARLFDLAQERDPDFAVFLVLAAATGARRSELVALRWGDIDLEHASVVISRGVVVGPEGLVEKDTKTHQARRVSLDPTSLAILQSHRDRWDARLAAVGDAVGREAYVFTNDLYGGAPWRPDSATRDFVRLCRLAGVKGIRLHDLRHYVATQMLTAGVDVRTVAGRLGHRNASTTLNVYAHFLPEADRQAAQVLGRVFDDALRSERSAS